MKEHANGGTPPQRLLVFMVGRFQVIHTTPGKVWINDTDRGDGGSFDLAAVESALQVMYAREF
jgi:hypothetical protein